MRLIFAICLMFFLSGCGPFLKSQSGNSSADMARKSKVAGNVALVSKSDDPKARTFVTADGIKIEAPGTTEVKLDFATDDDIREKSSSEMSAEFFRSASIGVKILAAVMIAAGIFIAIKFSATLGLGFAAVGALLLALEIYPWLLFVVLGAVGLYAAYLIYQQYATEAQKAALNTTLANYKESLSAVVNAVETLSSDVKEKVTSAVKTESAGNATVKDTITEVKREGE